MLSNRQVKSIRIGNASTTRRSHTIRLVLLLKSEILRHRLLLLLKLLLSSSGRNKSGINLMHKRSTAQPLQQTRRYGRTVITLLLLTEYISEQLGRTGMKMMLKMIGLIVIVIQIEISTALADVFVIDGRFVVTTGAQLFHHHLGSVALR